MRHILRTTIMLFVILCGLTSDPVYAGDDIKTAGDILMAALPVTAAVLTLGYRDREGTFQFGESMLLSLGATYGLKFGIDAKRPNGESQSFPSAHASISFSSAEFMRKRYGWECGIPAYLVATFVAYSREEADEHYTRDVIAGAVIGIASSYLFTRPYQGWHIQPAVDHAYYGIQLSHSW